MKWRGDRHSLSSPHGRRLHHRALGEFETNGRWQLVRKGLGVEAFGLNVVEIEQGYSIPEHNELERDQEEVFVVLEGERGDGDRGRGAHGAGGDVRPGRAAAPPHCAQRREQPVTLLIVSAPTTSGYTDMGWA